MATAQDAPQSLMVLMEEPAYTTAKKRFQDLRKAFLQNPQTPSDLKAYAQGDNEHEYTVLKGLVPRSLVGHGWAKSETFFTDYEKHYPESNILSATETSLVIANKSSYDVRQYDARYDPESKDRTASTGMSYFHFLVIPRARVYNAVVLQDTDLVDEMIIHFRTFWDAPGSKQKFVDRIRVNLNARAEEVIKGYDAIPETACRRKNEFTTLMAQVNKDADALALELFGSAQPEDFFFGFHAAPDASVGHLHMHVLLAPAKFRRYSTNQHDWKTIPAQAIKDVINSA